MARCILHVGMHKTGTTSIQNSLHHYSDESFYYARLGNSPNHSLPVYSLFADHPERHHLHRGRAHGVEQVRAYNESVRSDFLASIGEAGDRTVVISGEDIAILKKEEIAKLKDFLAPHFAQIDVYAYIRPPGSFMSSAFQQTVRSGRQVGLNVPKLYRNFRASFEKFDDLFGRQHVHLKKFDRALLHKSDVVLDFCQQIGLPLPEAQVVKSNEGSSKEFTSLLLQYNRFCRDNNLAPVTGSEAAVLERALAGMGRTKFRFAPSLLQTVIEENREDIVWMEERLGASLDETSAEDMPTDVRGEEDLLAPMPGLLAAMETATHDAGLAKRPAFADVQSMVFHAFRNAVLPQKGRGAARHVGRGTAGSGEGVDRQALRGAARKLRAKRRQMMSGGEARADASLVARAGAQKGIKARDRARPDSQEGKMIRALENWDKKDLRTRRPVQAIMKGPAPMLNKDKNLVVLWSLKSACTTTYVWFAHVSGFSDEVKDYPSWPHRHRQEQYLRSALYRDSVDSGMTDARVVRIIRDPYSRAVSIYRHALRTHFADAEIEAHSGGRVSADTGYSFQYFLDVVAGLDMRRADMHFRPQFHPYEQERTPDRVINISKTDLFAALNAFEAESGLPVTDFGELDWLHSLETKRKAKQDAMEGEALDTVPFTRRQVVKLNEFPSYSQLLTPEAKAKIEQIYKVDFDAYRDWL